MLGLQCHFLCMATFARICNRIPAREKHGLDRHPLHFLLCVSMERQLSSSRSMEKTMTWARWLQRLY